MQKFEDEGRIHYTSSGFPRLKQYLDEMPGVYIQSIWDDISSAKASERLGYPTQKPIALLERIIKSSSNPGDVVLDPFFGTGTTGAVAKKLHRHWLGIEQDDVYVKMAQKRLDAIEPEIFAEKVYSDKVRKGLKFFFNLRGRACGMDEPDNVCNHQGN